jgi:type I restriction-modification system DNA methylase subunit
MFSSESVKFHTNLSKKERQDQGIFFTPKNARDQLWDVVKEYTSPETILEPSFGTGEFLADAKARYPQSSIYGVEKNPDLFNSVSADGMDLSCRDFMEWKGPKVDLIVANPPYFVLKTKKKFSYMSGRPNIYVSFLYKCLTEHLKEDGVLAFIIPTSIYNCSYYQGMRDYLYQYTTILHVETLVKPKFKDTTQSTCLLVLRNGKYNQQYWFMNKYISPHSQELIELTQSTTTLKELGLGVKTGNVVWNQHKSDLSDEGTLLIYASNISNNTLELNNLSHDKKQYVRLDKTPLQGEFILVSRGYGNSSCFNAVKVNLPEFYAENHLNVIYVKEGDPTSLDRVLHSFNGPIGKRFIQLFIGNGALSSSELETLFPI